MGESPPETTVQSQSQTLALAAARGGPEALDTWLRAEHPIVWRLCFGLLADRTEADDLAQDAMLHLSDRLSDWDPERPYTVWRNAVVTNLCRDRRRRQRARCDAELGAAQAGLPDRLPAPDDDAQRREVREALRLGLAALTPREREVFVLRDLEGVATRDAAATLGITEGTVRSLLTLARRRLRGLLAQRVPGLVPDVFPGAEGGRP
jgi:RNA polymerase sigma-70 factor, ECF subfamily